MKKKHFTHMNKGVSIWLIVCLLLAMVPFQTNEVSAATVKPITIAQGDQAGLAFNDGFDAEDWNIGYDAELHADRIQLTPPEGVEKGYAYINDSIHLSEELSFNAKYTFQITESDPSGADGIAFVIQSESNTAGAEGEGMGYSGISPSVVVEVDTYYNPGVDPSASHIAIMKNGDYTDHLAWEDVGTIDQSADKKYTVWVDYNGSSSSNQMKVYFSEDQDGDASKPDQPTLEQTIVLQDIFGDTSDVFVGFSSATGGSYSKHEILGVLFDSEYTSSGIEENDEYTQADKPETPDPLTVTKGKDQPYTVTPPAGATYIFYDDETDVKPLASGAALEIESGMNTHGKKYYYSVVENGVQSDRAEIEVLILEDLALGIKLNDEYYAGVQYTFNDLSVTGSDIRTILISFNKTVSEQDRIVLPSPASDGFTVSSTSATNDYTKRINLDESVTTTAVRDYLREVSYEIDSDSQSVQVVVTSEDVQYDTYYSSDTEHYYQHLSVNDAIAWTDAYDAAKSMSYMDRTGYLATIMSKDEDIFVNSLSGGEVGWLGGAILKPTSEPADSNGATDGALLYYNGFDPNQTTDAWYWMNGPEIGEKFYASTGTRNTVNEAVYTIDDLDAASVSEGYYFNWGEREEGDIKSDDDREPNTQIGPNEDNITEISNEDLPENKREMMLSTLNNPSLNRVSRQGTDF